MRLGYTQHKVLRDAKHKHLKIVKIDGPATDFGVNPRSCGSNACVNLDARIRKELPFVLARR